VVEPIEEANKPNDPTCCDLACYEDPGCACAGCKPTPAPALDVERLARAMRASDGVNWPCWWEPEEFDWIARQVARAYKEASNE
jgi:hypothetical protein